MKWIREGEIFSPTSYSDPDSARAFRPWVIEDQKGVLKMWYSGHDGATWRILRATKRPDEPWERNGVVIDTGFSGDTDGFGVESPCVVTTPAGYLMAYGGSDGEVTRLHMATSQDGEEWVPHGTIMQRGAEDALTATDPCLMVSGPRWWLFYSGYVGSSRGRRGAILGAISSSGASWDRMGPVLEPEGDEIAVSHPCVLDISRTYYMFYAGGDGTRFSIAMASSSDGAFWQRRGVTLSPSEPKEASLHTPCALRLHDGSLHIWYAALGTDDAQLGYRIYSARFPGRWSL